MISKKQILNFKKRGFVKIKCLDKIKLENLKNQLLVTKMQQNVNLRIYFLFII